MAQSLNWTKEQCAYASLLEAEGIRRSIRLGASPARVAEAEANAIACEDEALAYLKQPDDFRERRDEGIPPAVDAAALSSFLHARSEE